MNYEALRRIAAENTAKQHLLHSAKEQVRLEVERNKRQERSKSLALQQQLIAEGHIARKQREESQRLEDKRKAEQLPHTRNIYAMRQELVKRGLQSQASPRPPSSNSKRKIKPLLQLSREEKAARRQAALFEEDSDEELSGGMALAQAQKSKQLATGGMGSKLEEARVPNVSRTSSHNATASGSKPAKSRQKDTVSNVSSTLAMKGSARDRLLASFNPNDRTTLNKDKRDTRTIEEVEIDMRKKRSLSSSTSATRSTQLRSPSKVKGIIRSIPLSQLSTEQSRSTSSTNKPAPPRKQIKRARPSTPSISGSDDDQASRPNAVSKEIQLLFPRKDAKGFVDEYSDESDDMEASSADVLKEEERAARMAAKEEREEVETSRKRAEQKRLRLQA